MPAKIKRKRIAQRSRKNPIHRKNKQVKRRKGARRAKPASPKVIANSVFALTLNPKPGFEVQKKIDPDRHEYYRGDSPDDYEKMYHDLLVCFRNAYKIIHNEPIRFSPLKDGLPIGLSLHHLIEAFKLNILPSGFNFNIDRDQDEYHFTIYKAIDFPWIWHTFEMKYIARALAKRNPALLKLYIQFMRAFSKHCGIELWFQGNISNADWWLEDRISNYYDWEVEEDEKEEHEEFLHLITATLADYRSGEAYSIEKDIVDSPLREPASIRKSLARFSRKNPIVEFMYKACDFMELPYKTWDFTYDPEGEDREDFNGEGVQFVYQSAILWDEMDEYSKAYGEMLDSEAQNSGVFPPIIYHFFTKHTKTFDPDWFKNGIKWPAALTKIWKAYGAADNCYRPKSKKLYNK